MAKDMIDIEKTVREVLSELEQPQTGSFATKDIKPVDVPRTLEHSLLNVGLTKEALLAECLSARRMRVATVCVAPYYVADAVEILKGSSVAVCAAVGLPSAFMSTEAKIADVRSCCMYGAQEIDLAINIAAVKSGDFKRAERDFLSAVRAADRSVAIKAAFEHGSYSADESAAVLEMIGRSGVKYVKIQNITSGHGARPEEIMLVKGVLGDKVKIKIDGGVKTLSFAVDLIKAGAARIGLTATEKVVQEALAASGV